MRRSGITTAANDFKNQGLIDYTRGHIRMLDRQGLQARACECYQACKDEYDRLYADLPQLTK